MPSATRAFVRRLEAAPFPDGRPHPSAAYADSSVLFVVPRHFDAARPFDIVVYLHGWFTDISSQHGNGDADRIWYGLDDQLDKTHRNALLIAPQLAKSAADGAPGKLSRDGATAALLAEARDVLAHELALGANFRAAFDAAPLVVVSYSGGYRAAACLVAAGSGWPDRVKAVLMLDSLYGKAAQFADWIAAGEGGTVFVSLAMASDSAENTLTPSIQLLKLLGGNDGQVLALPTRPLRLGDTHVYRVAADHPRIPVAGPPPSPLKWFLDELPVPLARPPTGDAVIGSMAAARDRNPSS